MSVFFYLCPPQFFVAAGSSVQAGNWLCGSLFVARYCIYFFLQTGMTGFLQLGDTETETAEGLEKAVN